MDVQITGKGIDLGAALQNHVEEFVERIEKIDEAVDAAVSSEHYFQALNELAPLLRAALAPPLLPTH